jgi:hypothetical protein
MTHRAGEGFIPEEDAAVSQPLPAPLRQSPNRKPLKPAGEWNSSRIVVKGLQVEHWLNGAKALEYELGSERVKAAVAQSKFAKHPDFGVKIEGHIMLADRQDEAGYRKIRIRTP